MFGYQLSTGGRYENNPAPPPPPPDAEKDASKSATPRIGIVTFVTDEHSYTHISLRNKDRKSIADWHLDDT
jgi:hypothetical protein